jgi:hypothetical protein
LTALAVRPDDRYSSAAEFADVISRGLLSPDQDATSLKAFLGEIFSEQIAAERKSEEVLVAHAAAGSPSASTSGPSIAPNVVLRGAPKTVRRRTPGISVAIGVGVLLAGSAIFSLYARRRPTSTSPDHTIASGVVHIEQLPLATRPIGEAQGTVQPAAVRPEVEKNDHASPTARRSSASSHRPETPQFAVKQAESSPPSADDYLDQAEQSYRVGHYVDAMNQARASLKREDTIDGRLMLGKVLLQLERFDDAAAEYQLVLSRSPDNQRAVRGLDFAHRRSP